MNETRKLIKFFTSTLVVIPFFDGFSAKVSLNGNGVEIIESKNVNQIEAYVQLKVDS